jgi:hypothetical protein
MNTLMQAHRQWATRPNDQRFTSLTELSAFKHGIRDSSRSTVLSSRTFSFVPSDDNRGLFVEMPDRIANDLGASSLTVPTNWSFGQMAQLAKAPGQYLAGLPSPIAADCLNYGMKFAREIEEVGILLTQSAETQDGTGNREFEIRAATGPNYGRIWDADLVDSLIRRFGDGVSGDWRVPGEFKQRVAITRDNTTIYASDRDLFVFLADEEHRIEIGDRRNGEPGSLARGFFVWNSEVGKCALGAAFFLFDYVCCNRIIWGARDFTEIRLRHTSGAPDRWLEEVEPVLNEYAASSPRSIQAVLESARRKKVDDLDDFLGKRFSKRMIADFKATHEAEEHRPIETLMDVTTAVTAFARGIPFQDKRIELEREAGAILQLAA